MVSVLHEMLRVRGSRVESSGELRIGALPPRISKAITREVSLQALLFVYFIDIVM